MRRTVLSFALLFLAVLPLALPATERVALVIGNDAYPDILDEQGRVVRETKLENCVRDATAVRDLLRDRLGFAEESIVFATDLDRVGVFSKLEAFQRLAAKAEIAVIYYAGHGMESLDGRETFLIPVDADLDGASKSEAVLEATGVGLGGILEKFGRATRGAKVVLLDCCRDRPKARSATGEAVRGGGLALLDEQLPADTLILLAAAPNRQASDGERHGPFTEALLEVLPVGGRNMLDAFFAVSDRVQETTRKQQVPWLKFDGSGAIFRENVLVRGVPVAVKAGEEPGSVVSLADRARIAELEKRLAEAEAMKIQPAPSVPSAPIAPSDAPPALATPMVRTDPVPAPAFPASSGIEGARAGEVREFGGIEMVWCPPGEFLMGSPTSEADRDDEKQHRVTLTKGFWMAKTETTQGQWGSVMGDNPSNFKGMDLPVETVSWDDVQGWLGKMNERHPLPAGWKWELPTEAQWEYACRAGTATAFAGELDEMAWYSGNSGSKTNPVGTKKANAWGLHDMHGNVWEWCADWYGDYETGAVTDPVGADDGSGRVGRGGGWDGVAAGCRSADRGWSSPVYRFTFLGFRVAAVPAGR